MKVLGERDIAALISLLDDEDDEVISQVHAELVGAGAKALTSLQQAASTAPPEVRDRIRTILDEICLGPLPAQFRRMTVKSDGDLDLEEGAFLLAKCEYPDLDPERYARQLDEMAATLRELLIGVKDPEQTIELLSEYLFDEYGFEGEPLVADPEDCFLSRVLDRKRGIPISISAIYMLLARRLALPIQGVGLPGRFICRYVVGDAAIYFDPVDGGTTLSYEDCARLCTHAGFGFHEAFLAPISDRLMLERMFNNIIHLYSAIGDASRARSLMQYLVLLRDRR